MNDHSLEGLLNKYLETKQKKNSRYSMRALARHLEMEPSFVSKILRKKYKLNKRLIRHIAAKIELDDVTAEECIRQNNKLLEGRHFHNLDDQTFAKIARWETFAILRYLDLDPALNASLIAEKLLLKEREVLAIIDDLEQLQLIEKTDSGQYRRLQDRYLIRDNHMRSTVNTKLTKEYILKALESVEKNPIDERIHMTTIFAIKKSTYDTIKTKIHEFALEVGRLAQKDTGSEEQVMMVNLNFFPVMKK